MLPLRARLFGLERDDAEWALPAARPEGTPRTGGTEGWREESFTARQNVGAKRHFWRQMPTLSSFARRRSALFGGE
jgi:hypothetical protein